jgi:hypothetical protein
MEKLNYNYIFKTIISSKRYFTQDFLAEIELYYRKDITKESAVKAVQRRLDQYIKAGILIKTTDGANIFYKKSKLTEKLVDQYGAEKIFKIYQMLDMTKTSNVKDVFDTLLELLDFKRDITPIKFNTFSNVGFFNDIIQNELNQLFLFIKISQQSEIDSSLADAA